MANRFQRENLSKPIDPTPQPYEALTKIEGPVERHIEQLWDEVKKLRSEITRLKKLFEER